MTTSDETDKIRRITVKVAVLAHVFQDGKLSTCLHQFKDGTLVGRATYFDHNSKFWTGQIYDMDVKLDDGGIHSYYGSTAEFAEESLPDVMRTRIQAESRSAELAKTVYQQAKKASGGSDLMLEQMLPLRRAYQNTNSLGRMAMEVRVLNCLRNGREL